jgi:uncharacterized protein (TIGR00730 family)
MKSICVYCGSADGIKTDFRLAARDLGHSLAEREIRLIYGGGKTGLMGEVADGVIEAKGKVTGVITESMNTTALAHAGLTRLEVTSTIHERKARMYELADGFIALPGGYGTYDELFETITWAQIGLHTKPIGLLNVFHYFAPLLAMVEHAEKEGFIFPEHRHLILHAEQPVDLLAAMENYRSSPGTVKRWMRMDD